MFLIVGANGQLGSELRESLGGNAEYLDRAGLDITDASAVRDFFSKREFDAVVNCAAYTAVDKAESEPALAEKINVAGARNLACSVRAPLVHVSTDYVFSGTAYRPYSEEDVPTPASVYGRTKLAGERAVLENAETAVVIRTAWLYSAYGNNFVKTIRRLGTERTQLGVVFDQVGSPTYAADLADAIARILPQLRAGMREVFHFTNEGVCSWFDFARAIMELSGLSCEVVSIESKDYPTAAARPFYSVLNKKKIKQTFGLTIPHWRDALMRCIAKL